MTSILFCLMLIYSSAGLLIVLLLRKPARYLFGAGPAFTLWALPLLLAVIPCLPSLPATSAMASVTLVLPHPRDFIAQATPAVSITRALLSLWMTGVAIRFLRLVFFYARLRRQTRSLPAVLAQTVQADLADAESMIFRRRLDSRRLRLHSNGPAVMWAPRSLLLIPPDFFERFNATERRLVLLHETTHLRRGDTWWNLVAELSLALLWFHPFAWLAMPRFRLDQELACDERVLRDASQDETNYANTLLHSIGMNAAPALIPWLAEPQLKERLTMIQRLRPGAMRRRMGFIGLTALMVGATLLSQAAANTTSNRTAVAKLSFDATANPHYPADAIKNHEEGTVLLDVLVGTDGKVQKVNVDAETQASPSLVKAASDAVMNWHFDPEIKNGKPVAGYAKIPVNFSMHDDTPPPPPPAPPLPPPPPPPPPAPPHASTTI